MQFKGKVVVITGATSGIGRAAAQAFAREGATVVIADKDAAEEALQAVRQGGGRAEARQTDVALESSVQGLFDWVTSRWGPLHVLVNNAGIYYQADAVQTPLSAWEQVLAVNLTGAFLCCKHAVPRMTAPAGGAIVNVASEAGLVGIRNQVAYNVSKAGLISLTKSCAVDFAARGIRVNCVCPGTTDTPLVQAALARAEDSQAARRALEQARPANRLGEPEEIAAAILFLAGDSARYATGAVLSVDGGYTSQ